jgi:hypothetical protein
MPAGNILGQVLKYLHYATGFRTRIGGNTHKVNLARVFKITNNIRKKHYNALKYAYEERILTLIVAA